MRFKNQKIRSTGKTLVLNYLTDLMGHFKKHYVYPSQESILKVLRTRYGYQIKRRQLNYILADLEKLGFISRTRRHKKDQDGNLIFRTTLYIVLKKGWTFIKGLKNLLNGKLPNFSGKSRAPAEIGTRRAKRTGPTALHDLLADQLGLKFE